MSDAVRVRFAPSPTGYLHVGGARTALFNWLYARKHHGTFILRVEDTDQARSTDESVQAIFDAMKWLDLAWDEGPGAAEPHAPYFQTQRLDIYNEYVAKLMAAGRAYKCWLTAEELEAKREAQRAAGQVPRFDRAWSQVDDETRARYEAEGKRHVIRFKAPDSGTIVVKDAVRGDIEFDIPTMVEDFVLVKGDGVPTYNYAVVIDDITMDVTHVIRGDDHLSNTPKQIAVYEALGAKVPLFCHLPLILGPDKSKLSKRHGTTSVMKFEQEGYLPEALLNYLVRLGWSFGDQEYFTRDELIEKFSLEGLNKAGSVFDFAKLEAMNAQYMKEADPARMVALLKPRWEALGLPVADKPEAWLSQLFVALKERARTLQQLAEASRPYFDVPLEMEDDARAKLDGAMLDALKGALEGVEWTAEALEAAFKGLAADKGLKLGQVIQPARAATVGKLASPGMYDVLLLLGRDLSMRRLADGAALASAKA